MTWCNSPSSRGNNTHRILTSRRRNKARSYMSNWNKASSTLRKKLRNLTSSNLSCTSHAKKTPSSDLKSLTCKKRLQNSKLWTKSRKQSWSIWKRAKRETATKRTTRKSSIGSNSRTRVWWIRSANYRKTRRKQKTSLPTLLRSKCNTKNWYRSCAKTLWPKSWLKQFCPSRRCNLLSKNNERMELLASHQCAKVISK